MKIKVLSSGSKGNTTYIEINDTKMLIDVGNTCKYISNKLGDMGVNLIDLNAIFLTHTHNDHINGLKVLSKKINCPIYMTPGIHKVLDYIENYRLIEDDIIKLDDIVINIIKISHDAPDPVGYIFTSNNKSLVYITDTGYINQKYFPLLKNKDIYIIESNHDIEMLTNGPYPFELKKRILSDKGHLSNYDSAKYLAKFIGNKTKCICLAHLSEENNTKEKALNTLIERLEKENIVFSNIKILEQNKEAELIEI